MILDGVGDAIDGTVEEISAFLFERLNKQAEGGEVNIANNTKTNTNTNTNTNTSTNKSTNKQMRCILVHLSQHLPCHSHHLFHPHFRWMKLISSTFVPRWVNWHKN